MTENQLPPDHPSQHDINAELPLMDEGHEPPFSKKEKRSGPGFFLWLLLLIIIAVLACIGWVQLTNLRHLVQENNQALAKLPDLESTLDNQIDANNQSLTLQQQQLSNIQNNLLRLNSLVTNGQEGWAIIEAKHLLQLANLSLTFEKNIPVTLSLLKLTDQHLSTIADPGLNKLRQLLASDITSLQSVQPVDSAGLYVRLQALKNQTLSLSLVNKAYQSAGKQNILAQTSSPPNASVWEKSLSAISQALSHVLIIRHRATPIEPLLGEDQEQILKQNLYWLYEQAQWSVLHQQPVIYQNSLEQITELLKTYFQLNTLAQSIITNITELQKINVAPALPDISNLIPAAEQYEKTRKNLAPTPTQALPVADPGQPIRVNVAPPPPVLPENPKQGTLPIKTPPAETAKAEII